MTEQILAVQQMQDYIEAHIDEKIGLSDLARVAHFSPWYCYRLFQEHTGFTPSNYLRRLRLSRAALRLKNDGARIIDAAFELGFGSADGFTRAFYREFGLLPRDYAASPVPIALFIPYGAKFRALRKDSIPMKSTNNIFIQVVHKPARKAIIKRGVRADEYFAYCAEVGCDVWGLLTSMDSLCGEPVCLWLPEPYRPAGTSVYVQGVETALDAPYPVPDGFDTILLPEADYLMFQGEPFREEDYSDAIASVQQAMNSYDPSVIGYAWDDSNPRTQLEPRGTRGYIELRAARRL